MWWELGLGVQGLGCRVHGSGFGVWGLEFNVQDLMLRIERPQPGARMCPPAERDAFTLLPREEGKH